MADYSPRPSLRRFVYEMERRLLANDHKGGWRGCEELWLMLRLMEEVGELAHALNVGGAAHIVREAADVANLAMMIADNLSPDIDSGKRQAAVEAGT